MFHEGVNMIKELPNLCIESSELFKLPYEALKWELLKTAIELKIFNYLSEASTASAISSELLLHPENTVVLLDALCAIGCLKKTNSLYKNTYLGELFFTTARETYLGSSLLFQEDWMKPVLYGGLKKLVQNGPPHSKLKEAVSNEFWEEGARANLNHARCGRAQLLAKYVSELPEFSSFQKILDLGAGSGIVGIAITALHPSLTCTLFEQAAVCKVANSVIVEYGMQERVFTKSGDYMLDDFGESYDFIMANFTLNFYRDILDKLMMKIYKSLTPSGVFMVTSDGMSKDNTSPAESVITWLPTKLQGMDMSFEKGYISKLMLKTGFRSTERLTITNAKLDAHGPIEMTIGRKACI